MASEVHAERNRALKEAGYHCTRCRANRALRVLRGRDGRLVVLCASCADAGTNLTRLYHRVCAEVLASYDEPPHVADFIEDIKCRLAHARIPRHMPTLNAVFDQVLARVTFQTPPRRTPAAL